jgi:hypothetical protein
MYNDSSFSSEMIKAVTAANGSSLNWEPKKQSFIAPSFNEAKYIALLCKMALTIFKEINRSAAPLEVMIYDQPAMHVHIDVSYHCVKEVICGGITPRYCPTKEIHTDGLTKILSGYSFKKFIDQLLFFFHLKVSVVQDQRVW